MHIISGIMSSSGSVMVPSESTSRREVNRGSRLSVVSSRPDPGLDGPVATPATCCKGLERNVAIGRRSDGFAP